MRVLFITAGYLPDSVGGVELHVAGLCHALRAAGHQPAVLARTGRSDVPHLTSVRDELDGVPVMRLSNTFEDATRLELLYAHPGIADAALALVDEWRPDVVHVHHLTCLSTSILDGLAERGIPTVMTLHDFWMGCPRGQRITASLQVCPEIRLDRCLPCLRQLWPHLLGPGAHPGLGADERDALDLSRLEDYHAQMQRVLQQVDALVTPSAFMASMYEAYGLPAGSVRVVENGLDTAAFSGPRPARRVGGPLRVGFIGSVLPSKGVHLLLQAFRQLGDPTGMRLDVWGEVLPFHNDRNYGERLEQLRKGLEHVVTLHGRYDNADLPTILASFDVLVVPSIWYESFCLTIREAFLAGVPVLASNHGAMAEAIRDGETGLLFEAGDADSLAAALRRLMADPGLAQQLSHCAGLVRDQQACADELLQIYQDLLVRRGRSSP